MNLKNYLNKIITTLENPNIPFLYYILTFIGSVTLRNFLEIFSDQARLPFKLLSISDPEFFQVWWGIAITFLHYSTFWMALIILLSLAFYFILIDCFAKNTRNDTGKQPAITSISSILRVLLGSSIILNITPIVDLFLAGGKDMDISYLYPKALAGFLPIPQGLTPGMICTSIAGITIAFVYCWIKATLPLLPVIPAKAGIYTLDSPVGPAPEIFNRGPENDKLRNIIKGVLGALALYTLLILTALLPRLLNAHHPIPIIRFLFIVIFMGLCAIFYLARKEYFLSLLKDVRPLRIIHFYLMLILGMCLTLTLPSPSLLNIIFNNIDTFILTLIATFLSWLVAVMLNNLEDCEIDKITNASRPLISGGIKKAAYQKMGLTAFILAGVFSLGVNFQTFFIVLLMMGNSFLYSLPPLRLRRIPIFSKLFISGNSLLAVMLGYLFSGGELLNFPTVITAYILIFFTLGLNFIDLKDYAGDKSAGIKTLPTLFGIKTAKLIIGGFNLVTYGIIGLIFLDKRLIIPGLILGGAQFLLINRKNYREKPVMILHTIGIILLIIYLIFAFHSAF